MNPNTTSTVLRVRVSIPVTRPNTSTKAESSKGPPDLGGADDSQLGLAQVRDRVVVEVQVRLNQGGRSERKPLYTTRGIGQQISLRVSEATRDAPD